MKLRKDILIFLFVFFISLTLTGCSNKPGEYDTFAKCLSEKDITMYGTEWCSHCKNQKKAFGKSFQYVNYVDCDFQKSECDNAGVSGYPTWIVDGEKYSGEQPLSRLAYLSGCEL